MKQAEYATAVLVMSIRFGRSGAAYLRATSGPAPGSRQGAGLDAAVDEDSPPGLETQEAPQALSVLVARLQFVDDRLQHVSA